MHLESVKLVTFSPTGTSRSVASAIADGLGMSTVNTLDITAPEAREKPLRMSEQELLVIAVPVYMGRVPAAIFDWLGTIRGDNTPTVCVVVYGNRDYEDALLELTTIVTNGGCIPIAGGAYIGEHSFSTPEHPVAQGRPNADDLAHAQRFGRDIRTKLESMATLAPDAAIQVPGVFPYRKDSKLWDVDFIAVSDQCGGCGVCADVCPVGAVDPEDSALVDQHKCITCCACIKSCPQQARSIKPGPVRDASVRLHTMFGEPKQPECFV